MNKIIKGPGKILLEKLYQDHRKNKLTYSQYLILNRMILMKPNI